MGKHKRVVSCIPIIRNPKLIETIKKSEALIWDPKASRSKLLTRLSDWEDISIEEDLINEDEESNPLLLMVTARSDPSKLIFPKGGLHREEAPIAGALRETWEEAGVSGICSKTILEPETKEKDAKLWCFEMKITKIHKCWPEMSQRRRVWLDTTNLDREAIEKLHTKKFTRKALKHWLKTQDASTNFKK